MHQFFIFFRIPIAHGTRGPSTRQRGTEEVCYLVPVEHSLQLNVQNHNDDVVHAKFLAGAGPTQKYVLECYFFQEIIMAPKKLVELLLKVN